MQAQTDRGRYQEFGNIHGATFYSVNKMAKNIARIAKLPYLKSELWKMYFVGRKEGMKEGGKKERKERK